MTDDFRKHLEMIQAIIARLAGNSFSIKGWSVTLVSALLAWSLKEPVWQHSLIALLPLALFWGLDAYFLEQERLFRAHYERVRLNAVANGHAVEAFSMDTQGLRDRVGSWMKVAFSNPVFAFHGALLILTVGSIVFSVMKGGRA